MMAIRLASAILFAGIALVPAAAQETGDVRQGRVLARDVCAACHAVEAETPTSPARQAPSFVALARTPGMTEMALNAALHTSHRTMPNLVLTVPEARNVIAYILSLKP